MPERPLRVARVKIGGNAYGPVVAGNDIRVTASPPDPAAGSQRVRGADLLGVHRVIVTLDVQGSSARNNDGQRRMRRALDECVHAGSRALGAPQDVIEAFDRGDGCVVVMPGSVTVVDVLDTFIEAVAQALREHNRAASDAYRIDLRAAVHVGYVDREGDEWSGVPLVHAARLMDAPDVKRILSEADDACLALVVSEAVKDVVDNGYGRIDPSGYRHVEVVVKETACDGWLRLL